MTTRAKGAIVAAMKHRSSQGLSATIVAAGLAAALAGPAAFAADKPAPAASGPAHRAAPKVKVDRGSGETPAQRDARLKRECKGRPNAGACLGYAS